MSSTRLGSPKKKKVSKILKTGVDSEYVDIPSLNTYVKEILPVEEIVDDIELENELLSFGYIPLSTIIIKDSRGEFLHKYIKAINNMGQKNYILIDADTKQNILADLTLIDNKYGNILPYSLKAGAIKMAGLDISGLAIECDNDSICMLSNTINDEDDNISITESNFTFTEEKTDAAVTENYGCYMSYPVVKLSEIRVNNKLVVEGANIVTRKLRNSSYVTYLEDMKTTIVALKELEVSHKTLLNLFETNALTLNESLDQLENWNQYYLNNKPVEECDVKKHNMIIHNMRIRNDYIGYLICGMMRASSQSQKINELNNNVKEYLEFFQDQFKNLDFANKI